MPHTEPLAYRVTKPAARPTFPSGCFRTASTLLLPVAYHNHDDPTTVQVSLTARHR